jgi:hypothetical protein
MLTDLILTFALVASFLWSLVFLGFLVSIRARLTDIRLCLLHLIAAERPASAPLPAARPAPRVPTFRLL